MENDTKKGSADVLVGVLKNPRDLRILLEDKWYRIPTAFAPTRPFTYLAFYQPAIFRDTGKQIRYYAKVVGQETHKRIELLPSEPTHPHAQDAYLKYCLEEIRELAQPVKNIIPRRVTFGFTSLERLLAAGNLLELYGIPPTEQIIAGELDRCGIPVTSEYPVGYSSGRFRIDLVIACRNGWLAIEVDNNKAHRSRAQKQKDHHKDDVLHYHGWRIVRLSEADVMDHLARSIARLEVAIASLGGLTQP